MELNDFQKMKARFKESDVDGKINLYVSTEGLTKTQYRELLQMFPVSDIPRLEAALS